MAETVRVAQWEGKGKQYLCPKGSLTQQETATSLPAGCAHPRVTVAH